MVSGLSYDCIQAQIRNIEFLKDLKQRVTLPCIMCVEGGFPVSPCFSSKQIYMGEGARPSLNLLC